MIVNANRSGWVHIGRLGENQHVTVRFGDLGKIYDEYPDATVTVLHQRPGDQSAYPVAPGYVTVSGGVVDWQIQSGDLTAVGRGRAELVFPSGGTIAKTIIYTTEISEALDGAGDPPEPWESWVQDVAESADEAKKWAIEEDAQGNPVPPTDTSHYHNSAKYWAGQAAAGATQLSRVSTLNNTDLAKGSIIEAVGIPVYVKNVSEYSTYGITEKGWYVFARVMAPSGKSVTDQTDISGADGYISIIGSDHVDIAIRFDTTAQSVPIEINWGTGIVDHFTFRASDLAVRNLDYRVTFYIYDISPYTAWEYALTTDTAFAADKQYYTKDENDVYTLATVTAGETIPAETYYNHSKVTFSGMTPNVTYKLDTVIDCPIEIVLPEVPDDGHGAWFEIQMRYDATRSCTLFPPEGIKIGTAQTQAQAAGINTIDLQYTVAGDVKMWTLLNTHANIPA